MVEKKTIAIMTVGAGGGIAQTFILREYVDKVYGKIPGLDGLGGFGTYSAILGLISGGITTVAGLVSVLTGKITKNETIQIGLLGYGIPALSGGILSGIFPVTLPTPPVGAPAPQIQLKAAGPKAPAGQPVNRPTRPTAPVSQTGAIPLRT